MKNKRILIVGGVAGGASVAARVRRLDEHAEIIMFERGPHVSFSNCALPFYLSRIVKDADDLVLMDPETFARQYNIQAKVNHDVLKIHRDQKTIDVKDLKTGAIKTEAYDYLVLSPGAKAILPGSIEGIHNPHVFSVRNVVDIEKIQTYIDSHKAQKIAVVGGGFIGVEVAENLILAKKEVTLIEAAPQVMMPFDDDMAQLLHREMYDHGIQLILNDSVVAIDAKQVHLKSGKAVDADVVIMAIGVRAEIDLAVDAGLKIGALGAIAVDHQYRTEDPYIYAVGDAIEVTNMQTRQPTRLTLAGPAQREARAAADHMYGRTSENRGVIGSSVVQCFSLTAACTGLNERACAQNKIACQVAYIIPSDKVGLMPTSHPLHLKLIFAYPSGEILGAQAIGQGAADKRIDVIATMIANHAHVQDLAELELAYSPMYSTAKDPVNHAALVALNLLNGEYRQVRVSDVRPLVEAGAFIIDAREPQEYAASHLKHAVNIPLSQFRQRLAEIPHDQPVYIHCRSGQRSYNMVRALQQLGYDNIWNISGSFLGICCYEYFRDKTQDRQPIVTAYNFH